MSREPTITNWELLTETILFRHAPFDGVSDSFDVGRLLDEFMPAPGKLVAESGALAETSDTPPSTCELTSDTPPSTCELLLRC